MPNSQASRPVRVFLHVATMGRYQEVLDEVLAAIDCSCIRNADIEVNVVGDGPVAVPDHDARITLNRPTRDITEYEHPSLVAIWRYCQSNPRAAVLYFNCLGGRYVGPQYEIRRQWRRLLYFELIERAKICLEILDNHDVCGIDWALLPLPHMTSNNWWVNGDYVIRLQAPMDYKALVGKLNMDAYGEAWREERKKTRHSGEFWIGSGDPVRPHSMLQLRSLGMPTTRFGVVPWWELAGVDWASAARRRHSGGWTWRGLAFLVLAVKFQLRTLPSRLMWTLRGRSPRAPIDMR